MLSNVEIDLTSVQRAARDVQPSSAVDWTNTLYERLPLPIKPYLLDLAFANLEFEVLVRPEEKIRWMIPMVFEGTECALVNGKMGMSVRVSKDSVKAEFPNRVALKATKIQKAMSKILAPHLANQINEGRVAIKSRRFLLRSKYEYFRSNAEALVQQIQSLEPPSKSGKELFRGISQYMNENTRLQREMFYNVHAALDAYFTWTEHLMLLALPLIWGNEIRVKDFASMPWKTKIIRFFSKPAHNKIQKQINAIRIIKEEYRNAITHGFLDREDLGYYAEIPQYGFVPIRFEALTASINDWLPVTSDSIDKIWQQIDAFDKVFMEELQLPIMYLDKNLTVYYSPEWVSAYQSAMTSIEAMEKFAREMGNLEDQRINYEDE